MNIQHIDNEQAEWLFKQTCTFLRGVRKFKDLPEEKYLEIAFAGRSNVGKSSLINALLNRKNVARTSNTPGRTQELNFFDINNTFYLVDMPGYGYAEAPKKMVQEWQQLMRQYFLNRATLKRVFVLIDSRHGLKKNDLEFFEILDEYAIIYQVILTKTDKIGKMALQSVLEHTENILKKHPAAYPIVISTSSEKKEGLQDLRLEIFNCCKNS
jgi:GTP-binding protein